MTGKVISFRLLVVETNCKRWDQKVCKRTCNTAGSSSFNSSG